MQLYCFLHLYFRTNEGHFQFALDGMRSVYGRWMPDTEALAGRVPSKHLAKNMFLYFNARQVSASPTRVRASM